MSKTVDERVVSMQFDNSQFEKNTKTTMNTLDKLKDKLSFKDSTKGFEDVDKASKKIDFHPIVKATETVKVKINAMQVAAITAISNMTTAAMNASKNMFTEFTTTPIKSGFQEYETQINAVQTILANTSSKGTTLENVNDALDQLNTYADKTIYNFTEMTRNIGTFTAAGIDLDTSVNAIQGIANLAAVSGSTSQQASTAMYQLSQALASGTVKLMDWNSVVNAGMGGQIFQDALKETAKVHGVAIDSIIEEQGSFRESLSEGWLTADVLTETLQKFTMTTEDLTEEQIAANREMYKAKGYTDEQIDAIFKLGNTATDAATKVKTYTQLMDTLKEAAQSGWTQSWETIIGDFEEAKELFTEASNLFGERIGKSADARNSLLEGALDSKWDTFIKMVEEAGVSQEDFQTKLSASADKAGISIDDLISQYGSMNNVIKKGLIPSEVFLNALGGISSESEEAAKTLSDAAQYVVVAGDCLSSIGRKYGMTWQELYALNKDIIDDPNLIYPEQILKLSDAQLQSIGYTGNQINALRDLAKQAQEAGTPMEDLITKMGKPSGRELLIDTLRNAITGLLKVFDTLKGAWRDVFPAMTSDTLYNIIEAVHAFSERLVMSDKQSQNLRDTLKGLLSIFKIIKTIAGGTLKIAFNVLRAVLGNMNLSILDVTAAMGRAITKWTDWLHSNNYITKALTTVVKVIAGAIKIIKNWVQSFMALPQVQTAVTKTKNAVIDFGGKARTHFVNMAKAVQEFVGRVRNLDEISLESIIGVFQDLKDNILNKFFKFDFSKPIDMVKKFFSSFVGYTTQSFTKTSAVAKTGASIIGTALTYIKDALVSVVKYIVKNAQNLATLGLSVGAIKMIFKISDVVASVANVVNEFGNILNSVAGVFKSFSAGITKYFKAKAFEVTAHGILLLAISIGILAASVALLTLVDPKKMWGAVGALTVLIGVMIALTVVIKKLGGGPDGMKNILSASLLLIAFGVAIGIMTNAMRKLAGLSFKEVTQGLAIILVLSSIIAGFALLGKIMTDREITSTGKMLVRFGVALIIMSAAIKLAGSMKTEHVILGIMAISAMTYLLILLVGISKLSGDAADKAGKLLERAGVALILMSVAIKICGSMKIKHLIVGLAAVAFMITLIEGLVFISLFSGESADKAGKLISRVGVAMVLMAVAMKIIATMNVLDIAKGLIVVTAFGAIVSALILVSSMAGENANKAGTMLMQVSVLMLVMVGVLALCAMIPDEALLKGISIFGAMTIMMSALMIASKSAEKSAKGVIAIGVVMILLAGTLALLTKLDPEKLMTASISMGIMTGMFSVLAVALKSLEKIDVKKALPTLLGMSLVIVVLGGILAVLSILNVSNSIQSSIAIGLLLTSMASALIILSNSKSINFKTIISTMGAMSIVVASLAAILGVMSMLNVEGSIQSAVSIGILLNAMASAILVLSLSNGIDVKKITPMLVAITVMTVAVAAILGAMDALDVEGSIPTAIAISILISSLADAGFILSKCGKATSGGIAAVGTVLALLAGITIILGAIGALAAAFPAIGKAFEAAVPIMGFIGEAIGMFFGSLMGGIIQGVATSIMNILPNLGTALSNFMINLDPFIQRIKLIDSASMESAKMIADMILILTAASFIDAIGKLFGVTTWGELGEQLIPFAESMVTFSETVSGKIDSESVTSAANAGKAMAKLAKEIPNSGGFLGKFFGNNDIDDFGEMLESFGTSISKFAETVTGMDTDAVNSAANAGSVMAKLADKLPNSGGVVEFFTGGNDLDDFGEQLESFGESISDFAETVTGMDTNAVEAAANAGTVMATLANSLNDSTSVIGFFTGDDGNLAVFGGQLALFGYGIMSFHDAVFGLNIQQIYAAVSAGKSLASLAREIPTSGLIKQFTASENDMGVFSLQLVAFGYAIKQFGKQVTNLNTDDIKAAAEAGTDLAEMAAIVPTTGGAKSWWSNENNISEFGDQLEEFGNGIKKFSDSVTSGNGVDKSKMQAAISAASGLVAIPLDSDDFQEFFLDTDFSDFSTNMKGFAQGVIAFANEIKGANLGDISAATTAGEKIVSMAVGIKEISGSGFSLNKVFDGTTDFAKFNEDLVNFATAMKDFSEAFKEVDTTTLDAATTAGGKVFGMLTGMGEGALEQIDSTFSSKMGYLETGLTKLGNALTNFNYAINTHYGNQTVKTDFTGVKDAVTALNDILGIIDELPEFDVLLTDEEILAWTNQLQSVTNLIGNMVYSFSNGLVSTNYASELLDASEISKYASAANSLFNLAKTMHTTIKGVTGDNILQWSPMASDIDVDGIETMGKAVKAFSDSTYGVSVTQVSNGTAGLREIGTCISDNWGVLINSGYITDKLITFGEQLVLFSEDMASIDSGPTEHFAAEASLMFDAMVKLSDEMIEKITGAFSKGGIQLTKEVTTAMTNARDTALDQSQNMFTTVGEEILSAILEDLPDDSVSTQFKTVLDTALSVINDYRNRFISSGKNLISGFIMGLSGISDGGQSKIKSAATVIGETASGATRAALGEHSPSKVFYSIGEYATEGFVNGLVSMNGRIYNSTNAIGDEAKNGIVNAMSSIRTLVDEGVDEQLTIRPVLDLSDVSSGLGAMNGMINSTPAFAMAGSISTSINRRIQNGNNHDVVSAIEGLQAELGHNSSSNTYNINGITYDDGSNVASAIQTLINAARIERRM